MPLLGRRNWYANANPIPFVQSSGTGKSRLMVQLGQECFVLVLNLREDDPKEPFVGAIWNQFGGESDLLQRPPICLQCLQVMEPATYIDGHWLLGHSLWSPYFPLSSTQLLPNLLNLGRNCFRNHRSAVVAKVIQNSQVISLCLSNFVKLLLMACSNCSKRSSESCTLFRLQAVKSRTLPVKVFFEKLRTVNRSDRPLPFILTLVCADDQEGNRDIFSRYPHVIAYLFTKSMSRDSMTILIHFASVQRPT